MGQTCSLVISTVTCWWTGAIQPKGGATHQHFLSPQWQHELQLCPGLFAAHKLWTCGDWQLSQYIRQRMTVYNDLELTHHSSTPDGLQRAGGWCNLANIHTHYYLQCKSWFHKNANILTNNWERMTHQYGDETKTKYRKRQKRKETIIRGQKMRGNQSRGSLGLLKPFFKHLLVLKSS